ncbi:uncharacterized protein LACBIDRAFT_315622 [Laccaria bicolor S238N-H82]|uniref:Predicted protein n=1 Tax=Laccaria bicolor (strain S238N-H82 / ATCC MYA-4686) TaxID=486041 RepID=B0D2S8_LACBS|nr:uncharacterized protein LACBIDRAFT_315622 [Laccaria bicolor S238N-H82]EDR11147.1 predicted protein [Laccaria bicolor S238N-H82]|eukprot:XP_001878448.1 predicted protein [Laccaria bicolor S238N-H82]
MPDLLNTPPPYQVHVPASSNCQTYHSTDILLAASSTTASGLSATGSTSKSGSAAFTCLRKNFAKSALRDPREGWGIQTADIRRYQGYEVSARLSMKP